MGKIEVLLFHCMKYVYITNSKKNRIEGLRIKTEPNRKNPEPFQP